MHYCYNLLFFFYYLRLILYFRLWVTLINDPNMIILGTHLPMLANPTDLSKGVSMDLMDLNNFFLAKDLALILTTMGEAVVVVLTQ